MESLHDRAFIGLKWSVEGRYLAYHMRKNSASLTSDVVEIGVLNLETGQSIVLSLGLKYEEWMAFASDKEKLAYIAGEGREAMLYKRLETVNLTTGEIIDLS